MRYVRVGAGFLVATVGTAALAVGMVLSVPGFTVLALGALLWKVADRLVMPTPDEQWAAYLSRPTVQERARRQVRDSR